MIIYRDVVKSFNETQYSLVIKKKILSKLGTQGNSYNIWQLPETYNWCGRFSANVASNTYMLLLPKSSESYFLSPWLKAGTVASADQELWQKCPVWLLGLGFRDLTAPIIACLTCSCSHVRKPHQTIEMRDHMERKGLGFHKGLAVLASQLSQVHHAVRHGECIRVG